MHSTTVAKIRRMKKAGFSVAAVAKDLKDHTEEEIRKVMHPYARQHQETGLTGMEATAALLWARANKLNCPFKRMHARRCIGGNFADVQGPWQEFIP